MVVVSRGPHGDEQIRSCSRLSRRCDPQKGVSTPSRASISRWCRRTSTRRPRRPQPSYRRRPPVGPLCSIFIPPRCWSPIQSTSGASIGVLLNRCRRTAEFQSHIVRCTNIGSYPSRASQPPAGKGGRCSGHAYLDQARLALPNPRVMQGSRESRVQWPAPKLNWPGGKLICCTFGVAYEAFRKSGRFKPSSKIAGQSGLAEPCQLRRRRRHLAADRHRHQVRATIGANGHAVEK
jgi:hypothetical protein